MNQIDGRNRSTLRSASLLVMLSAWLVFLPLAFPWITPTVRAEGDSCVWCHQKPEFKVTNKKLFDYFQQWGLSIHAQEGISCSECHGGNPGSRNKSTAHGSKRIGASEKSSPVHYRNIPRTCAKCHEEFYNHYRKSKHFKYLSDKDKKQGPNCVTCHASVSTRVLNVNTVRATCEGCHNQKTGNHPDIPKRAEFLLSNFLSIHRFLRYLTVKGDLLNDRETVLKIEERTDHLFVEWHTFDLEAIERKTAALLMLLKQKRNEIRQRLQRGQRR